MPKVCLLDNNNTASTLYAPLYYPIVPTFGNQTNVASVNTLQARQNNLGSTITTLQVVPSQFLQTISFDIIFSSPLINSFFNINGYVQETKLCLHDVVCYQISPTSVHVSFTARDSSNPTCILVLQN